jgi:hypothetical protein
MVLGLTRTQLYALMILAFLTIVAFTIVALYAVGHIDVWHSVSILIRDSVYYPGH